MLESVQSCPICKGTSLADTLTTKDFTITNEEFQIKKCTTCAFLITTPRPDIGNIGKYYESKKYISHSGGESSLFDKAYLLARRYSLTQKKILIEKYKGKASLLDYGCGTGEFLAYMQSNRWKITGVEPSQSARAKASTITQKQIYKDITEAEGNYDVITLWHVLEHIHDLAEKLHLIKSALAKNGIIFIAVPNHESFDASDYKEFWAAYDVPRHLWHFSQKNMNTILNNFGLKIIGIEPMKLDSYYVSMLSESYKNPARSKTINLVNAIRTGLVSNLKAAKTGNYSSLIYIATR